MYKLICGLLAFLLASPWLLAADLNIANEPLFISQNPPPLALLVMGRNHKIFQEAYNDASDLNGDGVLETRYNPSLTMIGSTQALDYYGYFDSHKCYRYDGGHEWFYPVGKTDSQKRCTHDSNSWSGDFLNYLTTSQIDTIRKVLYGGKRSIDDTSSTVLERTEIPQDAHSWGKQYTSQSEDSYNASQYTPFSNPTGGKHHLFGVTSLLSNPSRPLLRVILNQTARIWEWASIERPVLGERFILEDGTYVNFSDPAAAGYPDSIAVQEYVVRVKVCDPNIAGLSLKESIEGNCKLYPNGHYKPTGLLHDFGESDKMRFGLLTGSYKNNLAGGVIRKNISQFSDEINNDTGQFIKTSSGDEGIVNTIDRFKIVGFGQGKLPWGGSSSYWYANNCGFITDRSLKNGECTSYKCVALLRMRFGRRDPSAPFALARRLYHAAAVRVTGATCTSHTAHRLSHDSTPA